MFTSCPKIITYIKHKICLQIISLQTTRRQLFDLDHLRLTFDDFVVLHLMISLLALAALVDTDMDLPDFPEAGVVASVDVNGGTVVVGGLVDSHSQMVLINCGNTAH